MLDFDLRKSITYAENAETRYRFVSDHNLREAIRIVAKGNAGTIKGSYQESTSSNADQVIVYAYKRGAFNAFMETQPQGEDKLLFAKAVSSVKVKQGFTGAKTFTLALLEAGEYELHFAAYNESAGKMMFSTMLSSEIKVNGSVINYVTLQSEVTTNISTNITGLF